MALIPLTGKIIVQRIEAETETPGGIIIPDKAVKKTQKGTVINVCDTSQLKKGAIVYFADYTGTEIEANNQKYLVLNEEDLLAVEGEGE